jgi:hypothetical protein
MYVAANRWLSSSQRHSRLTAKKFIPNFKYPAYLATTPELTDFNTK